MAGKWSTPKRCYCKDPATGRELGRACPKLHGRHHGTYGYDTRIPASRGKRIELRRFGFATQKEADAAAGQVWELIGLGRDDARTQARIGDEIFKRTKHGGELPSVEDVRRRLGLGRALDSSETFGEAWSAWLAGKRKARPSYANSLTQIGRNWLLPILAGVALDRVNGEHCAMVFERIGMFNDEIEAARAEKRAPVLPGDVRRRAKLVGVATQHRVFAALRVFLNHAWKRRHVIPFNPVYAVELEPETRDAPLVWDAVQVCPLPGVHRGGPAALPVAAGPGPRVPPRRTGRHGRRRLRPGRGHDHGERRAAPDRRPAGVGTAEVEGRGADRGPGPGQRASRKGAPLTPPPRASGGRVRVGRTRAACSPARMAPRWRRTGSPSASRSLPPGLGCQ
jgi:hypothetical protein